jgi:hypothetical protein
MSTIQESGQRIALDRIRVPDNVRSLDEAHVQSLAGSIALQGALVPLVVRADGDGFELVAGFHRLAAARSLELAEVPVVVRDADMCNSTLCVSRPRPPSPRCSYRRNQHSGRRPRGRKLID